MNPTTVSNAVRQTPDPVNGSSPRRVPQAGSRVDLLARLDADLLHPARLAGPHAWHPWGLTRRPPTDDMVCLVVPAGPNATAQIERITASLHDQLTSPTWPPAPPLDVIRHCDTLSCYGSGMRVVEVHVSVAPRHLNGMIRRGADHRDLAAWPVLDEHAALIDRIGAIDRVRPTAEDLADLAHWVAERNRRQPKTAGAGGLRSWMDDHRSLTSQDADRLACVVAFANQYGPTEPALDYLGHVMNVQRSSSMGHRSSASR